MQLKQAQTWDQIQTVRELFHEYSEWLELDLCFQNFERELTELPGAYAPPLGRLYLAYEDEGIAGCIALRPLDEKICEMKRLYIRPEFRNRGLGRVLVERLIKDAKEIGYERMRLDTMPGKMDRAIGMYRRFGFQEIPRYYDN